MEILPLFECLNKLWTVFSVSSYLLQRALTRTRLRAIKAPSAPVVCLWNPKQTNYIMNRKSMEFMLSRAELWKSNLLVLQTLNKKLPRGGGVWVLHMEAFVIARLMFTDSIFFVSSPDRSPPDPVLQVGVGWWEELRDMRTWPTIKTTWMDEL